jgi:hypothetical protein
MLLTRSCHRQVEIGGNLFKHSAPAAELGSRKAMTEWLAPSSYNECRVVEEWPIEDVIDRRGQSWLSIP